MTPQEFIEKWRGSALNERAFAQEHFIDLCRLIGHPTPAEADPDGTWFTFEKGVTRTGGGAGWADVWKRGHFGWEYKKSRADLNAALTQLQQYAFALENPPLLVVADAGLIRIHTNWTNTVQEVHTIALEELESEGAVQKLRWVFTEPERSSPISPAINLSCSGDCRDCP